MKYSQMRHMFLATAAVLVVVALFNWATGFRSPLLATVAAVVAIIVTFLEVRHYQEKADHKRHAGDDDANDRDYRHSR